MVWWRGWGYRDPLKLLNEAKLNKLKTDQLQATEKTEEVFITAMDYLEWDNSDCRWKTVKQAKTIYAQLMSKSARLNAIKEQILILKLGFGWMECGHKWSENGYHFTSKKTSWTIWLKLSFHWSWITQFRHNHQSIAHQGFWVIKNWVHRQHTRRDEADQRERRELQHLKGKTYDTIFS